jgi:hypothetical protein
MLIIGMTKSAFSADIKLLPDKPTKEFLDLSKEEIWNLYKAERLDLYTSLKDNEKLVKSIHDLSEDVNFSSKLLLSSNKKLDDSNKLLLEKYPSNSFLIFLLAGVDYNQKLNNFGLDCYINIAYKKYFLYDKVYFQIGAGFKFYDNYGGGLNIGIGFNWK